MYLLSISEDILSFVSGLGLLQGILLALLIWFHPKADHTVTKFLSLYIACLSIIMSGPLLLKLVGWKNSFFVAPFPVLCGPLMYLYVRSFKETMTWQKVWPHLVVFFVYLAGTYWWVNVLSEKYPDATDFPQEGFRSPAGLVFFSVRYLHLILYYFLSRKALGLYQQSISQVYSETSRINLNWVKWLINGYILIILISVVLYFFMTRYIEYFYLLYLVNIAMATPYIYMATYKGITQPTIWQSKDKQTTAVQAGKPASIEIIYTKQQQKQPIIDSRAGEVIAGVISLMEKDKLYQEPELTLQDLADKLNCPAHQVSQAINDGMKKSFYDLVNGYRVEEAKRLLLDPENKNYTILSVGFEAGFNSKTTFNTVFKKFTGMTPTEFKNKEKRSVLSVN